MNNQRYSVLSLSQCHRATLILSSRVSPLFINLLTVWWEPHDITDEADEPKQRLRNRPRVSTGRVTNQKNVCEGGYDEAR